MKKLFRYPLMALLVALVAAVGCNKSNSNNAQVPIPDISDFTITGATPFAVGSSSTVSVYSSLLGSGTYKVFFDLSGSNYATSQSATLVISGDGGSFVTSAMANPGRTFITLNSITNINGAGTTFMTNNTYTLDDSTGLMTGTIGGSVNFRATDVSAIISGKKLTIKGSIAEPSLTTMTVIIDSYTHANGIIDFSNYDVPEVASIQYQKPGGGGTVSAHGTINIISVQPYLSGTFSFTGMDSSMVNSGTFIITPPSY